MKHKDFDFKTPGEVADSFPIRDEYDAHHLTSWADTERDLSAWLGNALQNEAIERIYSFKERVFATGREDIVATWAKLLTSDHFYYMCTKYWADGDVHKYFSPYQSPYDAYIFYMNALTDMEYVLNEISKQQPIDRSAKPLTMEDIQINALTAAPAKKGMSQTMQEKAETIEAITSPVVSSTSSNIKEDVLKKVKSLAKKITAIKPKTKKKVESKKVAVKTPIVKEKAPAKVVKRASKAIAKKKTN